MTSPHEAWGEWQEERRNLVTEGAEMAARVGTMQAEIDRLKEAFLHVAPICRLCDFSLSPEDVIAVEQPGEDGVWEHDACHWRAVAEEVEGRKAMEA